MKQASYKKLFTYWFSVIVYDLTVLFTDKYIRSWKLREQMDGSARSGKQNIVEGSEGMMTSIKTGIKLTNVAKASIEELIGDLEDFLRQRSLSRWGKDDKRVISLRAKNARIVRNLSTLSNLRSRQNDEKESELLKQFTLEGNPEKDANILLTLCHQATYLLHRQVLGLERKHEKEGGYTEKLYRKEKPFGAIEILK